MGRYLECTATAADSPRVTIEHVYVYGGACICILYVYGLYMHTTGPRALAPTELGRSQGRHKPRVELDLRWRWRWHVLVAAHVAATEKRATSIFALFGTFSHFPLPYPPPQLIFPLFFAEQARAATLRGRTTAADTAADTAPTAAMATAPLAARASALPFPPSSDHHVLSNTL